MALIDAGQAMWPYRAKWPHVGGVGGGRSTVHLQLVGTCHGIAMVALAMLMGVVGGPYLSAFSII